MTQPEKASRRPILGRARSRDRRLRWRRPAVPPDETGAFVCCRTKCSPSLASRVPSEHILDSIPEQGKTPPTWIGILDLEASPSSSCSPGFPVLSKWQVKYQTRGKEIKHIPSMQEATHVELARSLAGYSWRRAGRFLWIDEITVSAPNGRVDLEALKRPRLGGKEPSDDDYRV